MSHVDVQHVSYSLPDGRVLLDDITFRIPDGAVAALVGPNGAGKTTLLRMIAGDIAPDTGGVDPHILKAIAKAWNWRRKLESGAFSTMSLSM